MGSNIVSALSLILTAAAVTLSAARRSSACVASERAALLELKNALQDPAGALSSWSGASCCGWAGVGCDNGTAGHVVELDLSGMSLGGDISPSLTALSQLGRMNLSTNNFNGTGVPALIGSLPELTSLDLMDAGFAGPIPPQLGNLSSLRLLSLGILNTIGQLELSSDDLSWLSGLSSLESLVIANANLAGATDWLLQVNAVPSLRQLQLSTCQISTIPLQLPHLNLTSLNVLDLSGNNITSPLPRWLFNMTRLQTLRWTQNKILGELPDEFAAMAAALAYVDLSFTSTSSRIPSSMGTLCMLQHLDLSWNNITGDIADLINGLSGCSSTNLTVLMLQHNEITGTIPESIGQLSGLNFLDISSNLVTGAVTEAHFDKLSALQEIFLSQDNVTISFSPDWDPPFRATSIFMPSCLVGPRFPAWLRTQTGISQLDLTNAGIADTVPEWFWNLTSEFMLLKLAQNALTGTLPPSLESISISLADLSSNSFEGPVPRFGSDTLVLYLHQNSFTGELRADLGTAYPVMKELLLSDNRIGGAIPESICQMQNLQALGLANNALSGELPQCLDGMQNIRILDLGGNNISGSIPESIGSLTSLLSLHLNGNRLAGIIPQSLKNCSGLLTLDLGENRLSGSIPAWLAGSFPSLMLLRLHSNTLSGGIPPDLSAMQSLQMLDIGDNLLSGGIPSSFGTFTAMARAQQDGGNLLYEIWGKYIDNVQVYMKGRAIVYNTTLALVTNIDLSSNGFTGEIPGEITRLSGLLFLNLSGNALTGKIPSDIGEMKLLESLDLSRNDLDGAIPPSLATITTLAHLNLSFNKFSGRIPTGFQLQTLDDPSIYEGNAGLCGPPLADACPAEEVNPAAGGGDDVVADTVWFYAAMGPGFVSGALLVGVPLVFLRTLRTEYFRMVDLCFRAAMKALRKMERWLDGSRVRN